MPAGEADRDFGRTQRGMTIVDSYEFMFADGEARNRALKDRVPRDDEREIPTYPANARLVRVTHSVRDAGFSYGSLPNLHVPSSNPDLTKLMEVVVAVGNRKPNKPQ